MSCKSKRSIAFLGNYLPRKCGIATFTTDICEAVAKEVGSANDVFSVAMTDIPEGYAYPDIVKLDIPDQSVSAYEQAADFINSSKVDVLCIQHEYGIFGGKWGEYLHVLLRKLKIPVVTVLHTVREKSYDDAQEKVFEELVQRSDRIVVMSKMAIEMLVNSGVSREKIVYIPHGIPNVFSTKVVTAKENFDFRDKTIMLTFGLLRSNKGVEYVIDAMGKLARKYPDLVYIILGATHPGVIKLQGEKYRHYLMRKVDKLGLQKQIIFHDRFVELDELCEYISAADFYVVPYLTREQITSGTLCYALGAGKAVVSTPSWAAEELLADGRGVIVPFENAEAIASEIDGLMQDPKTFKNMQEKAYEYGRHMVWKEVAKEYVKVFDEIRKERDEIVLRLQKTKEPILSIIEFPVPKLDHLVNMTDDFAIFQHARYTVPSYEHGYSVSDNTRALVVASKAYRLMKNKEALVLLKKYLSFVFYAQREDGLFRNFYDATRRPMDELGSDDCQGRVLWGLGYVIGYGPPHFGTITKSVFEKLLPHVSDLNVRGTAYALLGLYYYLVHFPGDKDKKTLLGNLADRIMKKYEDNSREEWQWYEDKLGYANGLLPAALWVASNVMKDARYKAIAEITSEFLIEKSTKFGHLSLNMRREDLYRKEIREVDFEQRPIDALWLVELGKFAYRYTGEDRYLKMMRTSFDWFLGVNDVKVTVYDRVSGGCYDGLNKNGVNLNQGAESSLNAVLGLLSITEMAHQQSVGIQG
ncbi:MAG: glycosyltransferase family 4 protein [Candidatus Omnitrophica bacterium]|nr:glycosyltransferase family 4 protein [Candidatus Omnitrophota bacterium]